MGPRRSLTVRSARSFYEWSQRTGPDDPSETNLPVFQRPPESGHMPAGGQVRIRDQATQCHQKAGRSQPIREKPAKRNPALRLSNGKPACAEVCPFAKCPKVRRTPWSAADPPVGLLAC